MDPKFNVARANQKLNLKHIKFLKRVDNKFQTRKSRVNERKIEVNLSSAKDMKNLKSKYQWQSANIIRKLSSSTSGNRKFLNRFNSSTRSRTDNKGVLQLIKSNKERALNQRALTQQPNSPVKKK